MPNTYYDHTTYPQNTSLGVAALARAEFQKIEAGFDKLIDPATHSNQVLTINPGGTAMTGSPNLTFNDTTLTLNGILTGAGLQLVDATLVGGLIAMATITDPAISSGTMANTAIAGSTITGGTVSGLTAPLAVADGGTGATSAPAALAALGAMPIAGGIVTGTVTISAGNLTISAGDLAVSAGGMTMGGNTLMSGVVNGSASWNPNIADGVSAAVAVTAVGAEVGDFVLVSIGTGHGLTNASVQFTGLVLTTNNVRVMATNHSGVTWAPGAVVVLVKVFKA